MSMLPDPPDLLSSNPALPSFLLSLPEGLLDLDLLNPMPKPPLGLGGFKSASTLIEPLKLGLLRPAFTLTLCSGMSMLPDLLRSTSGPLNPISAFSSSLILFGLDLPNPNPNRPFLFFLSSSLEDELFDFDLSKPKPNPNPPFFLLLSSLELDVLDFDPDLPKPKPALALG